MPGNATNKGGFNWHFRAKYKKKTTQQNFAPFVNQCVSRGFVAVW